MCIELEASSDSTQMITIKSSRIKGRSRGDSVFITLCKCVLLLVATTGLICCGLGYRNSRDWHVSLGRLFCEGLLLKYQQRMAPRNSNRDCKTGSGAPLSISCSFSMPTTIATLDRRLSLDDNENDKDAGGDDDDGSQYASFDAEELSNRIKQVRDSESETTEIFASGLEQRVRELRSAKAIEEKFDSISDGEVDDENSLPPLLSLPVICFDALLPNQKLEGSTQDTTFIKFLLQETGLGGWFVMTSFEYRSRKVRRNGVLCKVEFLDAAASPALFARQRMTNETAIDERENTTNTETETKTEPSEKISNDSSKTRLPTSVDFVIVGKRRCRLAGKSEGLESRIGRWRRVYDENGEESVLGWGMERFTDLLPSSEKGGRVLNGQTSKPSSSRKAKAEVEVETTKVTDPKQWSTTQIELHNLDGGETSVDPDTLDKGESLVPLLEEWLDLASNPGTYRNVNVTAAAIRVRRDQPILRVDPKALLKRAAAELGVRPDPRNDPTSFCFWAAALINPLPAMGVSLEIRGNLLEVRTLGERLKIVEVGLVRSIQNLKGERPF
jgi:hypothetical protein